MFETFRQVGIVVMFPFTFIVMMMHTAFFIVMMMLATFVVVVTFLYFNAFRLLWQTENQGFRMRMSDNTNAT